MLLSNFSVYFNDFFSVYFNIYFFEHIIIIFWCINRYYDVILYFLFFFDIMSLREKQATWNRYESGSCFPDGLQHKRQEEKRMVILLCVFPLIRLYGMTSQHLYQSWLSRRSRQMHWIMEASHLSCSPMSSASSYVSIMMNVFLLPSMHPSSLTLLRLISELIHALTL